MSTIYISIGFRLHVRFKVVMGGEEVLGNERRPFNPEALKIRVQSPLSVYRKYSTRQRITPYE